AGLRNRIVHEAGGRGRALLIPEDSLEQPPADRLDRATFQLTLDRGRVDGGAHVLDGRVAQGADATGLLVDAHADDMHSHAWAEVGNHGPTATLDGRVLGPERSAHREYLGQGPGLGWYALHADAAIGDLKIVERHL